MYIACLAEFWKYILSIVLKFYISEYASVLRSWVTSTDNKNLQPIDLNLVVFEYNLFPSRE